MANLLIGDVHGCYDELRLLLDKAKFDESNDKLWFVGDLISRGNNSLGVLRFIHSLKDTAHLVLGNHDLHLLAVHSGIGKIRSKEKLAEIINAPDCDELLFWLRHQPLLQINYDAHFVVAHAGIYPLWDLDTAVKCADDVQKVLSSPTASMFFLDNMYGDLPDKWTETISGIDRLRFITNAYTRMRYCYHDLRLDMLCKESPKNAPSYLKPWFTFPSKIVEQGFTLFFGHWAAIKGKCHQNNIYALDTGCCWGGKLTLLRFEDKQYFTQDSLQSSF